MEKAAQATSNATVLVSIMINESFRLMEKSRKERR
jgi:hypothetical protein